MHQKENKDLPARRIADGIQLILKHEPNAVIELLDGCIALGSRQSKHMNAACEKQLEAWGWEWIDQHEQWIFSG